MEWEWLAERYPEIAWREPVQMTMPGVTGYACRICIALVGIKGTDSERLYPFWPDCMAHIEREHPTG